MNKLDILHQCGKRVKTKKVQKVLGANSYVYRSYTEKTAKGLGTFWPPPLPPILNKVNNRKLWIWIGNPYFFLISQKPDIDKTYLCSKGRYEAKYQLLINKAESTGLKHLNDSKSFIEYSYEMDKFMKILMNKKHEILIVTGFTYVYIMPFRESFGKQRKRQSVLKYLSSKIDQLKQINKFKKVIKVQDITKTDELYFKPKL